MNDLRVQKRRLTATLKLDSGVAVRGSFFLSEMAATHGGPERIDDLLNGLGRFFPFEVAGEASAGVVLFNRSHIVLVDLRDSGLDIELDPSYSLAPRKTARLRLRSGDDLAGTLHIVGPTSHARISDFASVHEPFHYVEVPDGLLLVNFDHVLQIVPIADED